MSTNTWMRRAGLLAVGALATTAPVLLADETSDEEGSLAAETLTAASAWRDVLDAHRAPQLPPPSDTESAIVVLEGSAIADYAPADRQAALAQIALQQATVEPSLVGVGATINFRYRAVMNGFGIRVPTGRLGLVAELPEVKAVYPVTYLSPAQASAADPAAQPLPGSPSTPPASAPAQPSQPGSRPETIALIDAGLQPEHPWLGGGIGPDRLIVGGADLVNGGETPTANPDARFAEAHGTELAAIVLRSPDLQGLDPARVPRMLAYRVIAREFVDGRVRALARSDRVLAAMERAVDPNLDGNVDDRASVILLGVARGFGSGAPDPVALAAVRADAAGSLVVAPAGNDGPTYGEVGTVAGPAASEHVLTVGGTGTDRAPRTADLELAVGPAAARLEGLPLLGPDPVATELPIIVLAGTDGLSRGDDPRDYADANGKSRVAGAIAVVGRGGATLAEKARAAARAGASALAVWDQDGPGLFPGITGGPETPIPVLGLGSRQGQLLVENPGFSGRIVQAERDGATPGVSSFSSRGPTGDGKLEPDLVAPAVDVETAYPGQAGEALVARMTGTSAAAAQVAATALRVRVDRPDLSPADVRSLMVQAARPLEGVARTAQGAGVAVMPQASAMAIEPAVVSGRRHASAVTRMVVSVRDLAGQGGAYRIALTTPQGTVTMMDGQLTLAAGARAEATIEIPPGAGPFNATLHVIDERGASVGFAPVHATPAPRVPTSALRVPEVRVAGDGVEARVVVGSAERQPARLVVSSMHDLRLWLVPGGGGRPIPMVGDKQAGDWPIGTYRFVLTRRRANGTELAPGRYRLRVQATGADGQPIVRESKVFRLK